jgi:1,6-anhydro-N-acetylmuramate kinase
MRLVFGFMTGTSLDGLDAAAVRLSGAGLELRLVDIPATVSLEFPAALADSLRALASGGSMPAADIARTARELGELHAAAARELSEQTGSPDLACAHGQTVFHAPPDSWQLFNPWPLAREIHRPLVYDLRGADLAAGGQGAPITPIADWVMFRDERESRAIVNLGGYCNITLLPANAPPEGVIGMDVCACNHLLNAAARLALHQPFDRNGAGASRGAPDASAVDTLAQLLGAQRGDRRSLGSGDELEAALAPFASLAPHDLLASVVLAVARAIAQALRAHSPHRVLLAGGSTRNAALTRALSEALPGIRVEPTDAHRVPATHREAASFAVLGALCADRTPITFPSITGCAPNALISGSWINPTQR